jgi:hypothetical protein
MYLCKHRGVGVTVVCSPTGRHNSATTVQFAPALFEWLSQRLAACGPCGASGTAVRGRPQMLP